MLRPENGMERTEEGEVRSIRTENGVERAEARGNSAETIRE
ncbi:hypothetical protein [Alkalibacterium kapii]|nr:hypothetical protein [Alkalibacterium kapii]